MGSGTILIKELGESGIKIVVYLSKERRKLSDFRDDLHIGIAGVYRSMAVLMSRKIVVEKREGNTRYFTLTPKGQKLAAKILEAEEILLED